MTLVTTVAIARRVYGAASLKSVEAGVFTAVDVEVVAGVGSDGAGPRATRLRDVAFTLSIGLASGGSLRHGLDTGWSRPTII